MAATGTPAATAFWGATADLTAIGALADPAAAARLADDVRRVAERSVVVATTDRAEQLERVEILRWRGESDPDLLQRARGVAVVLRETQWRLLLHGHHWCYVNEHDDDGKPSWFVDDAVASSTHAEACARDGLPRPTRSELMCAKQAAAQSLVRERTRFGRGLAAVGGGASDDAAAVVAAEATTRSITARENSLAQSHGRKHDRPYCLKLAPHCCCTGSGVALEARSIAVTRRGVGGRIT